MTPFSNELTLNHKQVYHLQVQCKLGTTGPNGFPYNSTVSAMQQPYNIDDFNALINIHCSRFTRFFVCLNHYLFC